MVSYAAGDRNNALQAVGGLLLLLAVITVAAVQIYLLCTQGQTVGKRLVGVRIVRYPDGSRLGFVHAFFLRSVVTVLLSAIPLLGGLFALVDVLCIFQADQRCLHDQIAGTMVVQA